MNISIEKNEGVAVLTLEGEVDLNSSPNLRQQLQEILKEKIQKLCVDLSKVKYIDSSGIATLIEAQQKLYDAKGELRLAGIPKPIYSVFEIAKLDAVFSIFPDKSEALKGFE